MSEKTNGPEKSPADYTNNENAILVSAISSFLDKKSDMPPSQVSS